MLKKQSKLVSSAFSVRILQNVLKNVLKVSYPVKIPGSNYIRGVNKNKKTLGQKNIFCGFL